MAKQKRYSAQLKFQVVLCQRRWKNPHFVGLEFPSFGWCI